jgi:hypothetical protein
MILKCIFRRREFGVNFIRPLHDSLLCSVVVNRDAGRELHIRDQLKYYYRLEDLWLMKLMVLGHGRCIIIFISSDMNLRSYCMTLADKLTTAAGTTWHAFKATEELHRFLYEWPSCNNPAVLAFLLCEFRPVFT